jgi:hypothetical protein
MTFRPTSPWRQLRMCYDPEDDAPSVPTRSALTLRLDQSIGADHLLHAMQRMGVPHP